MALRLQVGVHLLSPAPARSQNCSAETAPRSAGQPATVKATFCAACHSGRLPLHPTSSLIITRPPPSLHPELETRRHVVTFDGARALTAGGGGDALALSCAGSASGCGCVDVSGAISGRPGGGSGRVGCGPAVYGGSNGNDSTSAVFESSACRVQATVALETAREGGETVVGGGGALAFSDGGQYFLPSEVRAELRVASGAEVVCPQWASGLVGAVNVSSGGVLWFAGGYRSVRADRCGVASPFPPKPC